MSDQTPVNSPGNQGGGMPESSFSQVLQRGGEELLLEKVNDRFTVNAVDKAAIAGLIQPLPADVSPERAPVKLTEIRVDPAQRDAVMQQVRDADVVNYASHVYQLKDDPGSRLYLTDQITIQFAASVTAEAIAQITTAIGLQQVKPIAGVPNTFLFETTASAQENPLKIANRLMQRSEVLTAEPNIVVRTQALYRPRDPIYAKQWHLNHNGGADLAPNSHVSAEQAWDLTRGIRSVTIAIMDDAVDVSHPDFQGIGKIVAPRDFKENDFLPLPGDPDDNHGTACAGVATAEENGVGSVGVAPGCALMPIRTTGFLDDQTIEEMFGWAVTKGASVISCSWGPASVYFPLSLRQRAALTQAATTGRNGKGCVIVFAAGNANRPTNGSVDESGWPNNALSGPTSWLGGFTVHPDVITVAASTSLNRKAAYSNWGAEVSVCAPSNNAPPGVGLQETGYVFTPPQIRGALPGLGIVTTDRVGATGYSANENAIDFGGTSSACPLVAGVAALVLSANPDLTAAEVRQLLQQTADKIVDPNPDPQFGFRKGTYEASGRCDWFGYGKVNAAKAVQAAVQRQAAAAIASSRQIQQQNTTSVAIPDNNPQGLTSTIQIAETGTVRSIQISVAIDHTFLGDLQISLISPANQTVLLQSRSLGRSTRLQSTYTLQTTPLLRRFLNQPAQGRWQLRVVDAAEGDTGTLNNWTLTLGV
ncbi:S8 family serine peptidase [Leptolyngbya sp. FACHB-321]|uniref:S8 family serine peptidase n=1 Tax=Leptolyngbya sp. FACHB-321 TaxID=2692807 RepID=UPI00168385C9|nr:S8 family serine peptidase [Leptolyngbya sp. FACHB-321]MBD2036065.1 S8 family serine peptidase [Leptolyngbya sp. FACHB-321]